MFLRLDTLLSVNAILSHLGRETILQKLTKEPQPANSPTKKTHLAKSIFLPRNSENNFPEEEEFAKFYVYHSDQVSDFEFNKECESLDDAIKVATDLLKKLGGDKTIPQYSVTITRSEKGYIQFDNFADAKKFKDDGFIPDAGKGILIDQAWS